MLGCLDPVESDFSVADIHMTYYWHMKLVGCGQTLNWEAWK